ncbi:MAG: aminopeptidase N [Planctomycetes bacterium]|nr:aminopeptidase N [Planctomycetota bacterium]
MSSAPPTVVHRLDYRPPAYTIDTVELDFDLGPEATIVRAALAVRRTADCPPGAPLELDGEDLALEQVRVDGRALAAGEYSLDGEGRLVLPGLPDRCRVETQVRIAPQANTQLSGLYTSAGNFCTQCEAMGFRRITYFLDRPDVMARYTTRITASKQACPVLLSNGNRTGQGELPDGRHWAAWEDPFPKPSYLFALVAGDLRRHAGEFVTRSGRRVALEVWVEPQNLDKCEHALRSLQDSMRWDEERYGREYDLDIYMVVAVNDFNMGAMENKGLNVFNSKYVLARPETATDDDYEAIQGVIGHEYFHNWTGNRVTCRDWFQLTLKEGLTVFRDQQFSADMTSAPVKRIADVRVLRVGQFPEDAGPMAHPIRPDSYISMDNFYTSTVYRKGAEVIRMMHTLLGEERWRRGMDLYFERHDGQAVTCDDFRRAIQDGGGVSLERFERWYEQAGTPVLEAAGEWDAAARAFTLTLRQSYPEGSKTAAGAPCRPVPIPVVTALLGSKGQELPLRLAGQGGAPTERVLLLEEAEQRFTFTDVPERPVPSLLRGFSAPVRLRVERGTDELAFLMAHDTDPFNRWDAGQELATKLLLGLAADAQAGRPLALDPAFVEAFRRVLTDARLDGSLKALALTLPAELQLAQEVTPVDPDALHAAREHARLALARALRAELQAAYAGGDDGAPYASDKAAVDRRRLKNAAMTYLSLLDEPEAAARPLRQLRAADNMTDASAALAVLANHEGPARDEALAEFYARWRHDPLVLDKWFTVQAVSSGPSTLARVRELTRHPDFTLRNPNRVRALVGAFAMSNQARFHGADGGGYAFLADLVLELDPLNPQVAARMISAMNQWRRFEPGRRALMEAQLARVADAPGLSKDTYEIVARALGR